jgi:hypothetical protein
MAGFSIRVSVTNLRWSLFFRKIHHAGIEGREMIVVIVIPEASHGGLVEHAVREKCHQMLVGAEAMTQWGPRDEIFQTWRPIRIAGMDFRNLKKLC